jgi:hypothetical protein
MKYLNIFFAIILNFNLIYGQKFNAVEYRDELAKKLEISEYMRPSDKLFYEDLKYASRKSIDAYFEFIHWRKRYKQFVDEVRKNGVTINEIPSLKNKYNLYGIVPSDKDIFSSPEDYLIIIPEKGPNKDLLIYAPNSKEYRDRFSKSEIVNRKESLTAKALAKPCNQ